VRELAAGFGQVTFIMVGCACCVAGAAVLGLIVGRLALAVQGRWTDRVIRHYEPIVARALGGDPDARQALAASPSRHHITIARMLVVPLIGERQASGITAAREVIQAMSLIPLADRLMRSRWWWRRALGVRALGLLQQTDRTAPLVAALDDTNLDVRNAALDALADMQNPAALPAIVVRLHDTTLHRGRRAAALTAFGPRCEEFLLDLAAVDVEHRLNYARALNFCGSATSRPALTEWVRDPRPEVAAAALDALAHVGLDQPAAAVVLEALDSAEPGVRAAAARALAGWSGAASRLARHLDDTWNVAFHAAQALRAMAPAGRAELEARARQSDLAGLLARQMLWEAKAHP
jgi:HEAT repeat protein